MEHAYPIIDELTELYRKGFHDPKLIWDWYIKVYSNAILYGLEEALKKPYAKVGLNTDHLEDWPVEKINWVPEELTNKLVPPIQSMFNKFKANLEKKLS